MIDPMVFSRPTRQAWLCIIASGIVEVTMRYTSSVDLRDDAGHTGVLLVNSGTAASLTTRAVRQFLKGLLSDPRVVELPRALWLPILYGFILPLRPGRVLRKYEKIWTPEGSPLLALSAQLRTELERALAQRTIAPVSIELGMLYSPPSVSEAMRRLRDLGSRRILVLPLYPQYSGSTTGAAYDHVFDELKHWRRLPELHFVAGYHDRSTYIEALRASVADHWIAQGKTRHLLISFHGIPERYVRGGDPYFAYCKQTARLLADKLKLPDDEWSMSFQSRFGAAEWLKPYTIDVAAQLPKRGIDELTMVCPGFAVDCLETLEEIDVENRDAFMAAGGRKFLYVPALNARPAHATVLADLIEEHCVKVRSRV
jgi:protoporphyrin/coproporphyrin ferrochelatase